MVTETYVPEAVKKQAKEAEELHRKMYPEQYGDTPVVETKPEEVRPEGTPTEEVTETPPVEASETTETAPETETTTPTETPEIPEDYSKLQTAYEKLLKTHEIMKNKYELGKHNEEYRSALEARDNRIANLEAKIAQLEARETAPPTVEVSPEMQTLFDEIKTDVGEDTANKMDKYFKMVASQAAQKTIAPVGQEINTVRQEIDSVRTNTQRRLGEDYVTTLTELCPDWQTIKSDPGFIDYLNEYDVGSGKARFDLAREGAEALDAERVAHWYNGYKREIGLLTDTPVTAKTVSTKTTPPKKGKEALIAPVSTPKGTVREPEKQFYTQNQLKDIARKIIELNQAGRIEDATKLAKDRDLAISERRVLP